MRFLVTRSSSWDAKDHVEIDTLADLIDFVRAAKQDVIIKLSDEPELEIYDGYRE